MQMRNKMSLDCGKMRLIYVPGGGLIKGHALPITLRNKEAKHDCSSTATNGNSLLRQSGQLNVPVSVATCSNA